jgi:hypothetical protein
MKTKARHGKRRSEAGMSMKKKQLLFRGGNIIEKKER